MELTRETALKILGEEVLKQALMKGYAGKLLDVDLSSESIRETRVPAEDLKNYVGGRGLAAKIAWDRLGAKWENVDPLGPENILLVLTGPLTGY